MFIGNLILSSPEINKYTNRQTVCSVIALTSNEHQGEGEVPLQVSGSCPGPVTAHELISSYRYSFLHCAPESEASSSPDISCHLQDFLQPGDSAGAETISQRLGNSGNCRA